MHTPRTQKTVLITGCSEGGLGDALARAFHNAGFRVLATARNPAKMKHFGDLSIETVILDVQSEQSLQDAVREVTRLTGGTLDILVNNSGQAYMIPVADAELPRVRQMFDVNVISNIAVTQAFLPLILKAAPNSMIVNNTSLASVLTMSLQGIYSGTKAAMAAINNALRIEMQPFGVRVVELKTGSVNSRFFENAAQGGGAKLPANSYYELARDAIERAMNGTELMKGAANPDVWAKQVVADLTKTSPSKVIWRGSFALLCWFATTFLPYGATDAQARAAGGMDGFQKKLQSQKKQS